MIIGVPKEIKNNENRVSLVPSGAAALIQAGHKVIAEQSVGLGSGISDDEYRQVGATIMPSAESVWSGADMIMKVKEPLAMEYGLLKEGLLLFTYLHLAPDLSQTKALMEHKVTAVAYETVQLDNGGLPLLSPMSEIAGRMAVQVGARFLERTQGGKGILLGGVPGVARGKVVIVGGGTVGTNAAKIAIGLGADVTMIDLNLDRLRYLDDIFGARVQTLASNGLNVAQAVKEADLVVGAVLIPGAAAPKLVTEAMVATMRPGSVVVDVAIDQGGCIQSIDRVTTHSEPTYLKHGVVHYAVANMPGAVARTSTFALCNATLPYALQLANKGWKKAVAENRALAKGVNTVDGKLTFKAVAEAHKLTYTPLKDVVGTAAD
jgi:alanine dehydrogenase